jgi:hypothetical protein
MEGADVHQTAICVEMNDQQIARTCTWRFPGYCLGTDQWMEHVIRLSGVQIYPKFTLRLHGHFHLLLPDLRQQKHLSGSSCTVCLLYRTRWKVKNGHWFFTCFRKYFFENFDWNLAINRAQNIGSFNMKINLICIYLGFCKYQGHYSVRIFWTPPPLVPICQHTL